MAIAAIAFDRFHVIQVANKAVDWVRQGKARGEGWLKKTRWAWLKDQSKCTAKEHDKMAWLPSHLAKDGPGLAGSRRL